MGLGTSEEKTRQIGSQLTLPLQCQLRYIREGREASRQRLIAALEDPEMFQRIIEVQERRLFEGYPVYGDQMWHYFPLRLEAEMIEELADALNYYTVAHWKG
jgi:hypothetical protein